MSPNLFLAFQTIVSPHIWFKRQKPEKRIRTTEHWESPVPGTYEHIPGRGWYLVALDAQGSQPEMRLPKAVSYSRVVKRYIFREEYESRKRHTFCREQLADGIFKTVEAGFFQLDDQVAWVKCWDDNGDFIPGPYERWCLDKHTGKFRKMLKGDDPGWLSRRESRQSSIDGGNTNSRGDPATLITSNPSTPRTKYSSTRASSMRITTAPSTPPSLRTSSYIQEEREAITPENVAKALARKENNRRLAVGHQAAG